MPVWSALLLAASALALLGKCEQLRRNVRGGSLFGMELSKEEARFHGASVFFLFALAGDAALPGAVLAQRALGLVLPAAFLVHGLALGVGAARVSLGRAARVAVLAALVGLLGAGGRLPLHLAAGAACVGLSGYFALRGGVRQRRRNRALLREGRSLRGQRPRVLSNVLKDGVEVGFGCQLLALGVAGPLELAAVLGLALVTGAFNLLACADLARDLARERRGAVPSAAPCAGPTPRATRPVAACSTSCAAASAAWGTSRSAWA